MTIGQSIRYHRKKLNLTQAQLAERLNVTPQAVSKWESGSGLPDLSMAVPLARALGTTTDELLRFGERYREYEERWKQALEKGINDYSGHLEVAKSALREFHWDKPFLYRAAMAAKILAKEAEDAAVREAYLGQAVGYARSLLENDPEDQHRGRRLYSECMEQLRLLWEEQEKSNQVKQKKSRR